MKRISIYKQLAAAKSTISNDIAITWTSAITVQFSLMVLAFLA